MNTCQCDTTGVAGYLNRLACGIFSGRTVNGAVHTALPCTAEDFLNGIFGLDHDIRANSTGQPAAMRQRFHDPDSCCLGGPQCSNCQKPDWSRAYDCHRFAWLDRRQVE